MVTATVQESTRADAQCAKLTASSADGARGSIRAFRAAAAPHLLLPGPPRSYAASRERKPPQHAEPSLGPRSPGDTTRGCPFLLVAPAAAHAVLGPQRGSTPASTQARYRFRPSARCRRRYASCRQAGLHVRRSSRVRSPARPRQVDRHAPQTRQALWARLQQLVQWTPSGRGRPMGRPASSIRW